ncbi:MAG: hypothetical protein ABL921_08560 [Pirellula sp.]
MRFFLLACIILIGVTGCGDNGGRVSVSGSVTFDGKPLEDGSITFGGDKGAAGVGKIVNGQFSLSESANESGVLPGNYKVLISSWFEERGSVLPNGSFSPGKTRIPLIYLDAEKSGLVADVQSKGKNHFTFELTSDADKVKKSAAK